MGIIKRSNIPLEDQFTQIPNAWVRDERLSYRARGILGALLSHTNGFEVTVDGLAARGGEGRDAVRTAVAELEKLGYLTVKQGRTPDGKLGQITWTIASPTNSPVAEKPQAVKPVTGESTPKKNNSKNTNDKKNNLFHGHSDERPRLKSSTLDLVQALAAADFASDQHMNLQSDLSEAVANYSGIDEDTLIDLIDLRGFNRPPKKVATDRYQAGVWLNKLTATAAKE